MFADTDHPGFDAIMGNPPFLGGKKISGHMGGDYLNWLKFWDGAGVKGNADLVARFVLRAHRLLSARGQLGYLAVNTLVQGDTLEVGLLQAAKRGLTIRRAQSSHPWPSRSANLEIVSLWASKAAPNASAMAWLDGEHVPHIGADLEPVGNVAGRPRRLAINEGIAFQGHNVLSVGFTMSPEQAAEIIGRDARYADVIEPYVIGRDLNQRPDSSASRWIINFREWPLERCEQYPEALSIVRRLVQPMRATKDAVRYPRMVNEWWKFWQYRQRMEEATAPLEHVLALSLVSNTVMPVRVPTGQVFAHKCAVFALDDFASLALLSSDVHSSWVIRYTSTMRTDINYSPSDVFLTFPLPELTSDLERLGEQLDTTRRALMLSRGWGLKTTYNHVHSSTDLDPDLVTLRQIHEAIDRAAFKAYLWDDIDPHVGHYPTKIGIRWTISPEVRFTVLDRLLEENHVRHEREQAGAPSGGRA